MGNENGAPKAKGTGEALSEVSQSLCHQLIRIIRP